MAESGQEIWQHFNSYNYPQMLEDLGQKLQRLWQEKGFEDPEFRLRLLLEEAVNNAWEHGNHCNPDLAIIIKWSFDGDFYFSVEDMGDGFDPDDVPSPVSDRGLERTRGRGVFLIKHYAHQAQWENGGRKLSCRLGPKAKGH